MPDFSVLHISTADNLGGSAKSAYKLHNGLRNHGVISRMLVRYKVTDDETITPITKGVLKIIDQIGRYGFDKLGFQFLFYPSSFALLRHPWFIEADIIQLYNIHGYYFSHLVFPIMTRRKKVVWRLSDMWPLTGHCSYSYECERWKTGCGHCPLLEEYPPLTFDLTKPLWYIKKWIYAMSKIHIVPTNTWMANIVKASLLLHRFESTIIPNGIDPKIFRPIAKTSAKEVLAIPRESKVILFSAHEATTGTRKGGEYVIPTLEQVCADTKKEIILIVLGERSESWQDGNGYQTMRLGFTKSDEMLAIVYSAADVLISPALAENFPNTVLESFACGTPAVAFDTGGVSDIVHHFETGYLAKYKDVNDLAIGIRLLLNDQVLFNKISRICRELVVTEFTSQHQTNRFIELYQSLSMN
jgi:glycosyltransferase involved in cell wall biosynthesis